MATDEKGKSSLRFVFLPPATGRERVWSAAIGEEVSELEIKICETRQEALDALPTAIGAFGVMDAELLESAGRLKWLSCPQAGPSPEFYFPELVSSSVIVTNMRGIFNDCISEHIMSFVLAFSRGLHVYLPEQFRGHWAPQVEKRKAGQSFRSSSSDHRRRRHRRGHGSALPAFRNDGDRRRPESPRGTGWRGRARSSRGIKRPFASSRLRYHDRTSDPRNRRALRPCDRFKLMKRSAIFVNIGRGSSVNLQDLT